MSPPNTIYNARSFRDLPDFQRQYGQLTSTQLRASASKCQAAHLPHLRLVLQKALNTSDGPQILPALARDHNAHCPRCRPQNSPQRLHAPVYDVFAHDTSIRDLVDNGHTGLAGTACCEFFVALADCIRTRKSEPLRSYNLRNHPGPAASTTTNAPTNASTAIVDNSTSSPSSSPSSSPPNPLLSSSFSVHTMLDDDTFQSLRSVPEDQTNLLAYMTDRTALNCLLQDTATAQYEFRARFSQLGHSASIGSVTVKSKDDGGIIYCTKLNRSWKTSKLPVMIRESKIASRHVVGDPDTDEIMPTLTNENLAQITVEAITTMRQNPRGRQNQIVIAVQCSVYSCFMHFRAGDMFHTFHDAIDDASRRALAEQYPEETCLYWTSTRWFCLLYNTQRDLYLCNFYSILREYSSSILEYDNSDSDNDTNDNSEYNDNSECNDSSECNDNSDSDNDNNSTFAPSQTKQAKRKRPQRESLSST